MAMIRLSLLILTFRLVLSVVDGQPCQAADIQSEKVSIHFHCGKNCLWALQAGQGTAVPFVAPVFEIDGKLVRADVSELQQSAPPQRLPNGVMQYVMAGPLTADPQLHLEMQAQVNDETAIVRFRYVLHSATRHKLTEATGANRLTYLATSLAQFTQAREVSLSNFVELWHSYGLNERAIETRSFTDRAEFMGPILVASNERRSVLLAYEHGSQTPDAFVHYQLEPDRTVALDAVKGNYVKDEPLDPEHAYTSIWMEAALVDGDVARLASTFRRFVLHSMAVNTTTREPWIFYNTWNYQERNKWQNNRPYLESMNEDRILREIDVAHRMGIEVFVLDTGWYEKTGDWVVSRARFPGGLNAVRARLDSYGMKLGLWFGPTSAAVSSRVVREHPEWRMSRQGKIGEPREIWETEKSYNMCMVSGYADAFADELIRLAREQGVRYFKWDAIDQYGCDDSHHQHGTEANTARERADSYGFQLVTSMQYVADKVGAAVPGTIVDFDVTESGRSFGLAFLASGKYFLINNGPYYQNYDVPIDLQKQNWNLFFQQGPARTWIARSPLTFDKWIPSVLFLTHYFPDDPRQWQEVGVASLILGQNGIWGDLPAVSDAGVSFIGNTLAHYKQVRRDITESDPVVTGLVSASPEIHEKIAASGRGAVVIFAGAPGRYKYITQHEVAATHWTSGDGVRVGFDASHHATIEVDFDTPGARIVFFGTGD